MHLCATASVVAVDATPDTTSAVGDGGPSPSAVSLDDYLDGLAHGQMEIHQTPGLGVSVVSLIAGATNRTYGYADLIETAPLNSDTAVFPIASISKVFVAVALLRAQDMGLLSLADEANDHLDFELPKFAGSRAITLNDLARHEAGFEERWLATGAGHTPDPRPWGEILASTYPRLIAPPGAYASYSNYGIALLGYIIQRASGQPYHEFLREQVTAPLGMHTTYIDHIDDLTEVDVVRGNTVRGGVVTAEPETFNKRTYPAGRVLSSLPDMSRLMYMLLNDGIGPDGKQILTSNAIATLFDTRSTHPAMPGIGIVVAEKDIQGKRFVGHGGDGGTHHTDMILSPEEGLGIFVAFLSAPGPQARDYFTRALVRRLFPESGFEPLPLPDPTLYEDLSAYTGEYRIYRWAFSSIERLLQLVSEFSIRDSGRGTLIVAGPLGAGEYVPTDDKDIWQNRLTGELISYAHGWNGDRILNLGTFPFVTAYRLNWLDKQSTNRRAYILFIWGLGLLAVLLLILAVRDYLGGRPGPIAGHVLLASSGLISAWGVQTAVTTASSMSEAALQQAMPAAADWILALPFLAAAAVLIYAWFFVTGWSRPVGWFAFVAHTALLIIFVAFLYYLNHWNALGWNYP